jgi:hypothetical protein
MMYPMFLASSNIKRLAAAALAFAVGIVENELGTHLRSKEWAN